MKKLLLLSLLGGVCLLSNKLRAKDRVADSPGTNFLHRFMSLRSGETRSSLPSSPPGFSLVDDSNSLRQGRVTSPAPLGFFTLKGLIVLDKEETPSLSYEISEYELDPYNQIVEKQSETIPLVSGDFYSGTSGKQVFELQLPLQEEFARLELRVSGVPLINDLWVHPGDSLIIHMDAGSGEFYFSGPDSRQAEIQMRLQDLAKSETLDRNPAMILSNVEGMLNTPSKKQYYDRAVADYTPGWSKKIEWLDTQEAKIKRAEELFSSASEKNPVLEELERERDRLSPERFSWLYSYWVGVLRKAPLEYIRIAKSESKDWAELIQRYGAEEEWRDLMGGHAPAELVESIYLENKLLSELLPDTFLELTGNLPKPLQDQVNALYLIRNYKNLADANKQFDAVISSVQSPYISEQLDLLYRSNLQGRPFPDHSFEDEQGDPITPSEWNGKLVMLDFWLSGCGACLSFAKEIFFPLMQEFKDHPDILFVTVSGDFDKELWQKSVESGRYSTDQSVNLYSGGTDHPTLHQNMIRSFPAQLMLDSEGQILQTGSFPEDVNGWIGLIESYLKANPNSPTFSDSEPKLQPHD